MSDLKKPFHERVAENLIDKLQQGTAPWQKPWVAGQGSFMPVNPTTGKRYKGINAMYLMAQGFDDARWMTYKQAAGMDAQVRKGESGTQIQYWKFSEEELKRDAQGKPVMGQDGQPAKIVIKLERPRVFFATVFNAEQIDGLPPVIKQEHTWNALERAETILSASGAAIHHGGDGAFYRPGTDSIHLPGREAFPTADNYYATALHELGHWTGHPERLDRDLIHPFGSEGYAKEELRAEIFSMILGDELDIGHDPGQHAAYVKSWIKVLKEDPLEIFRAAADAEKIKDYVFALELQQQQEQAPAQAQEQSEQQPLEQNSFMRSPDMQNQNSSAPQQGERSTEKTYIKVDYKERDQVKVLGAAWDKQAKSWYVPPGANMAAFAQWAVHQPEVTTRQYLAVPSDEYQAAKAAGALWDREAKSCYIGPQGSRESLQKWLPENVKSAIQGPALSPVDELADVLRSHGFELTDRHGVVHPILDGEVNRKGHRLIAPGDKGSEQSGWYKAYGDGRPAGVIQNNRTGMKEKWVSQGTSLSPEDRAVMVAEAATKLAERAAQEKATFQRTSEELSHFFKLCPHATDDHPYCVTKHVSADDLRIVPQTIEGLPTDSRIRIGKNISESVALNRDAENTDAMIFTAGDLLLPAFDVDGKIWTLQSISPEGNKRFAKNSTKEATFYPIGGMEALERAQVLFIGEGYATGHSVSDELSIATVAAFDSGNLPKVAAALHAKYPDKPQVICGDDDIGGELKHGKNPGVIKATEAAAVTGGKAIFPIFAPGEREANPKLTDFNDLATKSSLGREGVARQVRSAFLRALEVSGQAIKSRQGLSVIHRPIINTQGANTTADAPKKRRAKAM